MSGRILVIGSLLCALALAASGCGSKGTKANFDKITDGMTVEQVQGILGKGELQTGAAGAVGGIGGSMAVYRWADGNSMITITFINGKETAKLASGIQ